MSTIGLFARSDADLHPGGDTVQGNAILDFLSLNGHTVRRITPPYSDLPQIDVGIIMNLTRPYEAYMQAVHCHESNVPFILFPVYWDLDGLAPSGATSDALKKFIPAWVKGRWRRRKFALLGKESIGRGFNVPGENRAMRFVLDEAAFVCPNSVAERDHLAARFSVKQSKIHVLFNGIEPVSGVPEVEELPDLPECFVTCIGAIGPRKNQLNLVKAANVSGIDLVIVGSDARGAEGYGRRVRTIAADNVRFIPHQSRDVALAIMGRSAGHIQPSLIETPGLASLEAGSLGIPIVVSDVGPVREYFQELASYCDPYSVDSIVRCLAALTRRAVPDTELSEFINTRYRWDVVLAPLLNLVEALSQE